MTKVYMMISHKPLELPIIVADSPEELAEKAGTTRENVYCMISKWRAGKLKYSCYISVDIEDDD